MHTKAEWSLRSVQGTPRKISQLIKHLTINPLSHTTHHLPTGKGRQLFIVRMKTKSFISQTIKHLTINHLSHTTYQLPTGKGRGPLIVRMKTNAERSLRSAQSTPRETSHLTTYQTPHDSSFIAHNYRGTSPIKRAAPPETIIGP